MSDRPLFQNADEQEAAYAPQQRPDGSPAEERADLEEGDRGTLAEGAPVVLPVAAAGALGSGSVGAGSASANTAGGVAPAVGAAALADETDDDETRDR